MMDRRNISIPEVIGTRWISHEAMTLITSLGKNFTADSRDSVEVNTIHNPVLFNYYMKGDQDLY